MRIAGVIVTYNRKELLAKNILMQKKQRRKVDKLYIIDNHSTDDTRLYLEKLGLLMEPWIEYIYLSENTGGAGGFYYGTKRAYNDENDFVWLMDDDGRPLNENTLYELEYTAKILYCKKNKRLFLNSLVTDNGERLSFGFSLKMNIDEQWKYLSNLKVDNNFFEGHANPFNGTLISKEAIKKVGFPNKDFFMTRDETDYLRRCEDSNVLIGTVVTSFYHHPKPSLKEIKFYKISIPLWDNIDKQYYWIRNMTFSYKQSHRVRLFVNLGLQIICIVFFQDNKKVRTNNWYRAIKDARYNNMGEKRYESKFS